MRSVSIIAGFSFLINISVHAENVFKIPRGAWERALGDVPAECTSNCPNRGIALGGFGAGSFMYNISGSFGPWADEVGEYSQTRLSEAAFHMYERKGEEKIVKCLSTDAVIKPAWDKLQVGDGTYYALHPKGWCVYHCFNCDISSKFFSPIIPHNYQQISYPVPGYHQVLWDGRNEAGREVSRGVYLYRMVSGDFSTTKKMVMIK